MSINPNVTGLSGVTNGISALSGLLVATPQTIVGYQPQNKSTDIIAAPNGIPGPVNTFVGNIAQSSFLSTLGLAAKNSPSIVFNYEGDNVSTLQSDITDHYTEGNMPIQDQVAIKPVTVTATGYIGELNDIPALPALAALQQIANKLTTISGYLPGLSVAALIAYNEAAFAYNTAVSLSNSVVSFVQSLGTTNNQTIIDGNGIQPGENQNQQQQVYQKFYGYWLNRTLFTIQTPWAVFKDMAIESLTATQTEETNVISNFEVTFKQIRYVQDLVTLGAVAPANAQNQLIGQASLPTNQSPSAPTPTTYSSTSMISGMA